MALDLTDDQRKALVTYIEVIKGSKEQSKKVNVRGSKEEGDLHPSLRCVSSIAIAKTTDGMQRGIGLAQDTIRDACAGRSRVLFV